MKMQKMMVLAAACMLTPGLRIGLGQEAQPAADRPEKVERVEPRGGDGAGTGAGPMRPMARPGARPAQPSDEDLTETMAFMREHSPNRVKAMESLAEDSAARRRVLPFMVARFKALQAVKDEDAQLYGMDVKQVEIEDELYGLMAPARSARDRERIREKIKDAVRRQVEMNLAERELRLKRLQESLQREQGKLKDDQAKVDGLTDTRTNVLIQEGVGALRRDEVRRGMREDVRRDGRPAGPASTPPEK